jgi:cyanophycinase
MSGTTNRRGKLVLIGGDEDKKGARRLLRRALSANGASVVTVVPTASRHPARLGRRYVRAFKGIGARDVRVADVRSPADAARPEHVDRIEGSDLVFFTGGDQTRLAAALRGSPLLEAVRRAFERGATVAGTSAGATAAGDPMIYDGQTHGLRKGRVRHAPGFGLLPGVTVDTHFVERGRIRRLAQFLAGGRARRAIGLSEDTAVIAGPDGVAEVAGAGPVVVLSAERLAYSDYEAVRQDDPVSMAGLELGFLSDGRTFDLKKWSVVEDAGPD